MDIINESSLNRLRDYCINYDVACISAKKYLPDRNGFATQQEYDNEFKNRLGKQKKLDRKALLIKLKGNNYDIISIKGFYQYNKTSVPDKEDSFFVVNKNNDETFKIDVLRLAVEAKQNSIFYSEKGSLEGYWIYTGVDLSQEDEIDKEHNFGDVEYQGPIHFGSYAESEFGTGYSLVNGRPFAGYDQGDNVKTKVNKTPITHGKNNITVIEEAIEDDSIPNTLSKYDGNYISKFGITKEEALRLLSEME